MPIHHIPALLAVLVAFSAQAQKALPNPYGFESVRLEMQFSQVPSQYKTDCESPSDKRYTFCFYRTELGGVELSAEFYFVEDRVQSIRVHFARENFDTIWLALRERYGKEAERSGDRVEWFSGSRDLGQPMPDQLTLHRSADPRPTPDGKYIKDGVQYALIEYESLAQVRDQAKKRQDQRERQIRDISNKL